MRESLHISIDRRLKERLDNHLRDSSGRIPYGAHTRVLEPLIREWCRKKEQENEEYEG